MKYRPFTLAAAIEPYGTSIRNPNLVQITDPPRIPPQLNLIASEAVHNMRVALDCFACSLAVLNNRSMTDVYFPFAASVDQYRDTATQKRIKKLSAEAKRFIEDLKPYKSVNNFLWAVNELNKTDKHRNLALFNQAAPMAYFTPREGDNRRHPITQGRSCAVDAGSGALLGSESQ